MSAPTVEIQRPAPWRYVATLTLTIACPLSHDRDTCPCNADVAPCTHCRDGATCGCAIEVEVEYGDDVPGGFRIARSPEGCPLSGGRYTEPERAVLFMRAAAAWENHDPSPWCSSCDAPRLSSCVCSTRAEND